MTDTLISTHNLWPETGTNSAFTGLDLEITSNSFIGVIGPDHTVNAAWIRTLAGIDAPKQGKIFYSDCDINTLQKNDWQKSRISLAYLSQNTSLLSVLPTLENILLPALYHQLDSRNNLLDRMHDMLQSMGFNNWDKLKKLPAYIDEIAYCQAVIARVLLTRPKAIFINNAFNSLDMRNLYSLFDYLKSYTEQHNAALMLYSHEPEYVYKQARSLLFANNDSAIYFSDQQEFHATDRADILQYLNEHALR